MLAHPAWHAGIVGIVASRLAEEYNKPTVLLLTPEGKPARGSARSVTGVDIGGSIAACGRSALTVMAAIPARPVSAWTPRTSTAFAAS